MQKVFLEIGTADFDTLLPLCSNGWKGYFIEPVYEHASKLAKEVWSKGYNAQVFRYAISSYDGEIEMKISNGGGGEWTRGISHIAGSASSNLLDIPANNNFIDRVASVPCLTLDSFIKNNGITSLDYLKVDVEGHELEVFNSYSWSVLPTFIKVEHKHVDSSVLSKLLEEKGYIVYNEREDFYAVR